MLYVEWIVVTTASKQMELTHLNDLWDGMEWAGIAYSWAVYSNHLWIIMKWIINEAPGISDWSFINANTGIYLVWRIIQNTHTHTHFMMMKRVTHLLPSVSSVPGRCLCPEGGWPLEGAWQSWLYLQDKQLNLRSSREKRPWNSFSLSGWNIGNF